jgi:beta-lactamase regulating signal transducer with metallopeptidase domain
MTPDGFDTLTRLLAEAVLNTLWQGPALAALVWAALRLAPGTGAATRFAIWWTTLLVVLALPFARLAASLPNSDGFLTRSAALHLSDAWPSILTTVWAAIAISLLGRLAWSYGYVRWLGYTSTPADHPWNNRNVRLRFSQEVSVPMVIGLMRPAVLIPRALASQLSSAEFEQILLHEEAHIRRLDHWTNYALELAKALFFFQPAVWWIGSELRLQREIACDDAVVNATGQPVSYAGCLTKLVELNFCPHVQVSPGAAGDRNDLFRRVERLLAWRSTGGFSGFRFASALLGLVIAAACGRQVPGPIVIPAPSLALTAPRPAIEASRQRLVTEERIERANILMQTAAARMKTAERLIRGANRQMRLAEQVAQGKNSVPLSPVSCQQPPAVPQPHLNRI